MSATDVLTKEQVDAMEEREEKRRRDGWNQKATENGVKKVMDGQQSRIEALKQQQTKLFMQNIQLCAIAGFAMVAAMNGVIVPWLAVIVSDICFVALGAGLAKSYRLAKRLHKER